MAASSENIQAVLEGGGRDTGQALNTKPLFKLMVEKKASDLFFTANSPITAAPHVMNTRYQYEHRWKNGDIVFWDGHVGIMTSAHDLVHASAYHMVVVEEPLAEAKARIAAASGGDVIGARRPEGLSRAGC